MSRWPADTATAKNAFYGDPATGEIERQLIAVVPPFVMYYDGKPIKAIQFHKKCAPALLAALREIWEYYGRDQAKIDALGISKYAGAYNHRKIRGRENDPSPDAWSNHAWGCAIDLNADANALGTAGHMPKPVIDAFKAQGFKWGGDYKGRKDPMHFEAVDAGAPVALVEAPQTDADSDSEDDAPAPQIAEADVLGNPSKIWAFVKHKATQATGGIAGGGFLMWLTDWRVILSLGVVSGAAFAVWWFLIRKKP